jgi:hypothetical protein
MTLRILSFLAALLVSLAATSAKASLLFETDATWKYFKGTFEASSPDRTAWRAVAFDDSKWLVGDGPFYYENQPGSDTSFTGNTVLSDMYGGYTCVFLRKAFVISDATAINQLTLMSLSDDGFIAWINGTEVLRYNMPGGDLAFSDTSLSALSEPIPLETAELFNPGAYLKNGTNVIAIQAFNSSLGGSSDFVISASLSSAVDQTPPTVVRQIPDPNALVRDLTQIEVLFSEGVQGVDAADLLLNGNPASKLTRVTADDYVFEFAQPATGKVQVAWVSAHGIQDLAPAPNPFQGESWQYTLDPNAKPPGVIISEFLADNEDGLHDEDGDEPDWIELYNGGSSSVSLKGWGLTDRTNNLVEWRFPNVTLLSKGYLVVYASGKDRTNATAPLHTNFKLNKGGGYLALVDRSSNVVSEFGPLYPAQFTDVSYGREQSNPTLVSYFPSPTPGAANTTGGPGFSPAVDFSRNGGTFAGSFQLVLQSADPAAAIRYTLDGTIPTSSSPLYGGPIPISTTAQVRARSFVSGLLPGPIHSEAYLALDPGVLNFTSDLPLVVLHNFGGGAVPSGVRQTANITVFEAGTHRSSLTNAPELSTRAGISIRGSSTMWQNKKNFRMEFWDDYDADKQRSMLGMPADSDWILYACNNFEPVLIHNAFVHDLSRQIGRYSPRTRLVEVYVNTSGGAITKANYNGVYVLLEKIKIGNDRVDIDKLQPEHTAEPLLNGGYLLSVDRGAPGEGQVYTDGAGINTLDPKWEELMTPQRSPQYQFLNNFFNDLSSVLNGASFKDPVNGYAKYIDVNAAIDHHILNVLPMNVDALRLSSFFYKPRGGKLSFGPLWDFDRALGSTDGRDANPRTWRSASPDYGTDMFNSDPIFANPWYSRMFQDIDFWQKWIDRWQELRRSEFALTNLHNLVDTLANQVREAQKREVVKWPGFTTPRGGSYQWEVTNMKSWLSNRVSFIDTNFLAAPVMDRAGGPVSPGATVSLTAPSGATIYYTLDGTDPRASGGGVASKALTYGKPIALSGNARVVARSWNANHKNLTGANKPPLTSPWSGPVAATYVMELPSLAITELQYHPAPPAPGDTNDPGNFEFLELKNTGTKPVDLTGYHFTGGVVYTFSAASSVKSLAAGQSLLLVRNQQAFTARYPGVTQVAGEYLGSLNNAGEGITLLGPLQEFVFHVHYDNQWYPISDGPGFSLVLTDESSSSSSWSEATAWRPSSAPGGSPGTADPAPPSLPQVVINEALTHTDLPKLDTLELHNLESKSAPVGGWFLTDDFKTPMKYRIPNGTEVTASGFLVMDSSQFNGDPTNGFLLSSLGDELYLFSGDGTNLTGYVHGFQFGAAAEGATFGRYVSSVGKEFFVTQVRATLGETNAGPLVGLVVLSEVLYSPAPIYTNTIAPIEYVELYNSSSQVVPLYDTAAPTNTWRLDGGVKFDFPTNTVLPARTCLLVVNFDPDDAGALAIFRNTYEVSSNAMILGPWRGSLENKGEPVGLYRPDSPQGPLDPEPGTVPYLLVEQVQYDNTLPWPTNVDGTGLSLQRVTFSLFADDPSNWGSGAPTPGVAKPSVVVDSDGDGMPDDWESVHGLSPEYPGDAGEDADSDGARNLDEYLAGTDPRDSASYLGFTQTYLMQGGFLLRFTVVPRRSYTVQYRTSLETGTWVRLQDVPASTAAGLVDVIDPDLHSESVRFYRLVTPAVP